MKRNQFFLAFLLVSVFSLVACDPVSLIEEMVNENTGEVQISIAEASTDDQYYLQGTSSKFEAFIADVDRTGKKITRFIGMRPKLTDSFNGNVEDKYPLLCLSLSDTVKGSYELYFPMDSLVSLLSLKWNKILNDEDENNFLVIGVNDNDFYLAKSGIIQIDTLPGIASQIKGEMQNVVAHYLSSDRMQYLRNLKDTVSRAISDPDNYGEAAIRCGNEISQIMQSFNSPDPFFPSVTINGTFSAFRTNISQYLNAIDEIE